MTRPAKYVATLGATIFPIQKGSAKGTGDIYALTRDALKLQTEREGFVRRTTSSFIEYPQHPAKRLRKKQPQSRHKIQVKHSKAGLAKHAATVGAIIWPKREESVEGMGARILAITRDAHA